MLSVVKNKEMQKTQLCICHATEEGNVTVVTALTQLDTMRRTAAAQWDNVVNCETILRAEWEALTSRIQNNKTGYMTIRIEPHLPIHVWYGIQSQTDDKCQTNVSYRPKLLHNVRTSQTHPLRNNLLLIISCVQQTLVFHLPLCYLLCAWFGVVAPAANTPTFRVAGTYVFWALSST